jgi:hypothetical protein
MNKKEIFIVKTISHYKETQYIINIEDGRITTGQLDKGPKQFDTYGEALTALDTAFTGNLYFQIEKLYIDPKYFQVPNDIPKAADIKY